jgi:hypothetical protein
MSKLKALLFSLKRGDELLPILKDFLMKPLTGQQKRDADARDAQLAIYTFKRRLQERQSDDPRVAQYFHPSAIGQCALKLWFREMGAPMNAGMGGDDALRQHLTFEFGTYVHILFQNLCSRAGVLKAREVGVEDDKLKIIGHMDGILQLNGKTPMLEIKTINERGFYHLNGPKEEHIDQTCLYNGLRKLPGTIFVYFNKNTGETKEFYKDFDKSLFTGKLLPRVAAFHKAKQTRKAPRREGESSSKYPCTYCEYSKFCWTPQYHLAWTKQAKTSMIGI